MKCPFRKTIINLEQVGLKGTEEGFAECYKEECPYYYHSANCEECERIVNEHFGRMRNG